MWNSPLQRAENSGAEAFVSLRDEHLEAADGFNQLSVSLFQVLQLGRTFRSTRTQTWWGNQEKQVRTCPPALSPRLRSTDCFYCLRQAEKPEADRQDAHFQAQGSNSDRQAHQAGATTDQHLRSHHGRYEAPSPEIPEIPAWMFAKILLPVSAASRQESWEDSELFKPQPSSDLDALGKKRYVGRWRLNRTGPNQFRDTN